MNDSKLRVVWVYPDLLSTYGDRGNVLVLQRRARQRGLEVERIDVRSSEAIPSTGDVYLLGGGEDRPQRLAAERLCADSGLRRAHENRAIILGICAGYQILGQQFVNDLGQVQAGLGILDVTSTGGRTRSVGEIVAEPTPELGLPTLTGFENHMGVTQVGRTAKPLASLRLGHGNGVGDGTEGAWQDNIFGTYLHGPVLARNPRFADLIIRLALDSGELPGLDDQWYEQLRQERLAEAEQRASSARPA
ncbi:type 1 glutamine amidotransferase [Kitasatospora sp. NPDC056531]|uniref:type 1 glutamine amidotransferase n=1 Tax=Kitasatospora sp. NPDC056531 TaxID=3345856 RepID=UPI0036A9E470